MDRAVEHLGPERAGRYLRKFYPWYVERMDGGKELHAALQQTATVEEARAVLAGPKACKRPSGRCYATPPFAAPEHWVHPCRRTSSSPPRA